MTDGDNAGSRLMKNPVFIVGILVTIIGVIVALFGHFKNNKGAKYGGIGMVVTGPIMIVGTFAYEKYIGVQPPPDNGGTPAGACAGPGIQPRSQTPA